MQFALLLEPEIVASPVITDLPQVPAGLTHTLSAALIAMHAAQTPDQHAAAVDAALNAAMPTVAGIAQIFAVSWPTADADAADLVQEALLELTAALAFAPRARDARLAAWLSTTLFDALHQLWAEECDSAMRVQQAQSAISEESERRWIESADATEAMDAAPNRDPEGALLDAVLDALTARQRTVLVLRRGGFSWRAVAWALGTSVRRAQRFGARALSAARVLAARQRAQALLQLASGSPVAEGGQPTLVTDGPLRTATSARRRRATKLPKARAA